MKIALISPPWIPLPPKGYGGIEDVVFNLSEGLQKKGHNVIVYATGDSHISGELRYVYQQSLGIDAILEKGHALLFLKQIHYALKTMPDDIDIIHNHCEYYGMYLLDLLKSSFVHTLHGSFQETEKTTGSAYAYREVLDVFKHHPFVSISNFQRSGKEDLNYIATVYNAVNVENFTFTENASDYISWLGRYSPIKGLEVAIEASSLLRKKLYISAHIHSQRQEDFNLHIQPKIDNLIIFAVEKKNTFEEKSKFLGESRLFLFPIQWEEPFGLVMIEAMATGTPVVAFARGSVPEIVRDGETGFIVNSSEKDIRGDFIVKKTGLEGLAQAIEKIYSLPQDEYRAMRRSCRSHVEKNFSVDKMVEGYEKVYQQILSNRKSQKVSP